MRTNKLLLGLMSLALVALTACSSIPSSVAESIATAQTAEDHQKIAEYFVQKAEAYDAEAAQHEKMLASYSGRSGYPRLLINHCRSLREGFSSAANEARAMAQEHRQLAGSMAK